MSFGPAMTEYKSKYLYVIIGKKYEFAIIVCISKDKIII